ITAVPLLLSAILFNCFSFGIILVFFHIIQEREGCYKVTCFVYSFLIYFLFRIFFIVSPMTNSILSTDYKSTSIIFYKYSFTLIINHLLDYISVFRISYSLLFRFLIITNSLSFIA